MRRWSALPVCLVAAAAGAIALAGCGKAKFDTGKLEQSIQKAAEHDLHFPLRSVKCPGDISIKQGNVFYCRAVSRSGTPARVRVRQRDNKGGVFIQVPA
ncbi:MAG: DUF4333 domain-containing protein [Actinobacteria bacterium]|nr:MAG: DUF4333 domain-containing protein [Actinomycetota bacterium]